MIQRLRSCAAAAVAAAMAAAMSAQSASPLAIYVDAPSAAARDYAIDVDGMIVPAAALIPGPHPLSAIVVHDVSTSVQPAYLDLAGRQIANAADPGDRIRLVSFADRILFGSSLIVDDSSAAAAVREVTQTGGASPLWEALCLSADALRDAPAPRVIVVFSDGQANANDCGGADALDAVIRAGITVSVVGLSDRALKVTSDMEVTGRNGVLRRLADDTGGTFVELGRRTDRSGAPIANALKALRKRARLEFSPPLRNGAVHRVSVTARGRIVYGPARILF
jgi:hypothetical protein